MIFRLFIVCAGLVASFSIYAQQNNFYSYVLNCEERNGAEQNLIRYQAFQSPTQLYAHRHMMLRLPERGLYSLGDGSQSLRVFSEQENPSAEGLKFMIQDEDSRTHQNIGSLYEVRFGRMGTTLTFSGNLERTVAEHGVENFDSVCTLSTI